MPENTPPVPASVPRSTGQARLPRSARRRWLFRGVLLLLAWGAVELVSFLLIQLMVNGGMRGILWRQLPYKNAGQEQPSQTETFHPYVGWTHNPDFLPEVDCCGTKLKTNRYGFFDSTDGVHQRSPNRLIVAISGGSVAWQMSCAGADSLKRKLHEIPAYRDREIIIVRLAQSGYKQPQALFALNYYLLLGGEFDVVINLDGFNEIALPSCDNLRSNVALDYPQGWHVRTRDIVDPRDADVSLRVFEIRGTRQRNALVALKSPFRFLPSYQLLWFHRENQLQSELIDLEVDLKTRGDERQRAFVHSGPHPISKDWKAAMQESVRIWKQASLQMHHICEANHILYVHAIQPNQYDTGSKPLSEEEQEECYSAELEYGHAVKEGYPILRQEAEALRSQGVHVFDLTQVFSHSTQTLYIDPFCHVNHHGSEMLAEALGERVGQCLSEKLKDSKDQK